MSEPRLISPMLDGCIIGDAISCHNGVRCCPAIRQSTGEKFIVKIISIPASQVQLDALLLTGACKDQAAALDYFMELAQDILKDKDILSRLSAAEGFTPYVDAQVLPMENAVGYEVYLLSPYKRSLERIFATESMTHLGAVNLGLDLCAALAACRRAGYLYIDLKPENIFLSEEKGYRISDLGFVSLSSLPYTSLPEKFHSVYTPAEVLDAMAVLNDTMDVYALGLVLYQVYNGGTLPIMDPVRGVGLVPPLYADYEMADIILKACDADPSQRWADPAQMGQALVSYMQRNSVNNDPIIPPPLPPEEPEPEAEPQEEEFLPEPEQTPEELAFMQELTQDETAPSEENTSDIPEEAVTEETSQMLAHADDLIAHELPEPVVAPEAIEVNLPEEAPQEQEADPEEAEPEAPQQPAEPEPVPEAEADADIDEEKPVKPFRGRRIAITLVLLLLLVGGACLGGWYYYENVYMQYVNDVFISSSQSTLTVAIDSQISDELLQVACTDSYGNSFNSSVVNGVATFYDVKPQTRYTIRLHIKGFRKLNIDTPFSYTTEAQANIHSFTAGIGPADGSVVLNLVASGTADQEWIVTYTTAEQEEVSIPFSGNSLSISDLTVGHAYTFTLSTADQIDLIGQTQVTFVPQKILLAQNLVVTACGDGSLTICWDDPEGETVNSWIVRCYNEIGYDETYTVTGKTFTFTGLDHSVPCMINVTAEGMNQCVFTIMQANPITITDYHFDTPAFGQLQLSWDYIGTAPEGGWILEYSIDGGQQEPIVTDGCTVQLLAVPSGDYAFTVKPASGCPMFNDTASYAIAEAEYFTGYGIEAENYTGRFCLQPNVEKWNISHVDKDDYRSVFAAGEQIGFVIEVLADFKHSIDPVDIHLVLRDEDGGFLHMDTESIIWDSLWYDHHGAISLPYIPQDAGQYTLSVYLNGMLVTVQSFTIA